MGEHKKEFSLMDYKQLFEDLYPQLCMFACKYLNDLETSKDVVLEVFVKVWEDHQITFEKEKSITGYFYEAVKNECLKHPKIKHLYKT